MDLVVKNIQLLLKPTLHFKIPGNILCSLDLVDDVNGHPQICSSTRAHTY